MLRNLITAILISLVVFSCSDDTQYIDGIRIVLSEKPEYESNKLIRLEKLYSIKTIDDEDQYYIDGINKRSAIEFDGNNNMYVLGNDEHITVFNNEGKYLKTLAGAGQGPNEIDRGRLFYIHNERISVLNYAFKLKILDLNGNYISNHTLKSLNYFQIKPVGSSYYTFHGVVDFSTMKVTFELSTMDFNSDSLKTIFNYNHHIPLTELQFNILVPYWIYITSAGEFFFPEDNYNNYLITRYNIAGKKKFTFGRKYSGMKYSEKYKENFKRIFKRQIDSGINLVIPPYPPIVRKILIDNRSNIWIVSGETSEDRQELDFENTVDIFNSNGKWLYSFKSSNVSQFSEINNNRLYNITLINPETDEQFIDVYEIRYLK